MEPNPAETPPTTNGWRNNTLVRAARRLAILIIGLTVVLIGIALIILPGPAFIVIPAGLFILAIEFAWARRLLDRAKKFIPANAPRSFREAISMLRRRRP